MLRDATVLARGADTGFCQGQSPPIHGTLPTVELPHKLKYRSCGRSSASSGWLWVRLPPPIKPGGELIQGRIQAPCQRDNKLHQPRTRRQRAIEPYSPSVKD